MIQKLNDPPALTCPECSKDTLIRLVSAPGFQLKGTGWYVTDFKNKGEAAKKSVTSTQSNQSGTNSSDKKSQSAEVAPKPTKKDD